MPMNLLIRYPDGSWRAYPIPAQGLTLGRESGNHIVLSDAQASRRHAMFWVDRGVCYVRDDNSTNGTFINNQRVYGTQPVRTGDWLRIGSTLMQVAPTLPAGVVPERVGAMASVRTAAAPSTRPAMPAVRQAQFPPATGGAPFALGRGPRTRGELLKQLGLGLCLFGSLIAILFIPCKVLGMSVGWHFVLGDVGYGLKNYHFLDTGTLILELILINGIGMGLYFLGTQHRGS